MKKLILLLVFAFFAFSASAQIIITNVETSGNTGVSEPSTVLNYTITLRNVGNQDLTAIAISDILPDASTATLTGPVESISTNGVLNIGETWTYTTSYTVTAGNITAGTDLVSTASVTSAETGATVFSAVETVRVYEDDFDEVTITIINNVAAPTGSATQDFCVTDSPTVAGLVATGTAIQWYTNATGGTALTSTAALVDGTTYYASQTLSGCESEARLAKAVTINALDDASFSYSAAAYCVDDSDPTPTITGLAGGTFSSTVGLSITAGTG
ncbi:MAG: hypothetical protein V3V14_05950, partial [Saprospiraceae bacterium]